MQVRILKAFPYSEDGMKTRDLRVGEVVNINDDLIPGLETAGLIRRPGEDEAFEPTVLVGDPESMSRAEMIEATMKIIRSEINKASEEELRVGLQRHRKAVADLDALLSEPGVGEPTGLMRQDDIEFDGGDDTAPAHEAAAANATAGATEDQSTAGEPDGDQTALGEGDLLTGDGSGQALPPISGVTVDTFTETADAFVESLVPPKPKRASKA